jgi:hypothetical protein
MNHNFALLYFGVIALCPFLHFELCQVHNSETIRVSTWNFVGRLISLNRSAVQKNLISATLILELLPNVHFYTLNFVCDITLILQEVYLPVSKTYLGSITRFNRFLFSRPLVALHSKYHLNAQHLHINIYLYYVNYLIYYSFYQS